MFPVFAKVMKTKPTKIKMPDTIIVISNGIVLESSGVSSITHAAAASIAKEIDSSASDICIERSRPLCSVTLLVDALTKSEDRSKLLLLILSSSVLVLLYDVNHLMKTVLLDIRLPMSSVIHMNNPRPIP